MKKRFLSVFLALAMCLTLLPAPALAAEEPAVITITNDNVNDTSDAYLVDDDSTLLLGGGTGMGGTYSFVLGPNADESAFTFFGVQIGGYSTVQGGKAVFRNISNTGTISGGSFDPESSSGLYVENRDTGDISGGTFNGNRVYKLFVENYGIISGGTFYGEVKNSGTITDGTFEGEVTSRGTITGGAFNGVVINTGTISGGTFSKGILNSGGGTIADGVNATVAQGGDLAITMQTLGTGSITVKQNGIDIPYGKAGETYNVAASGGTLVGLYLLTGDETIPTGDFTIESDFRAILGGAGGYDFDMPDTAVTIAAVFDDYTPPTEISVWPHIIEGTDSASLEAAQWLDYAMPSLTFAEETTLPGDLIEPFITVDGQRYDFSGFITVYEVAEDTMVYALNETMTVPAEPTQDTAEWEEWSTSMGDGLMAAYMLHEHSYSSNTDATCDCGHTRTVSPPIDYTPPIPTGTEQNENGDTVTTAEPISIVRNDRATTAITITDGNRLVNEVVRNDSDQLVIAPKIVGNVSSAEITIPSSVMERFVERANADLRLVTPIADATIGSESIAALGYDRYTSGLLMEARRTENGISAKVTIGGETVIDAGVELPDGVEMTDDMKLIVSTEKATLAPIASTVVPTAETEYVDIPENNISRLDDIVDGYKPGENCRD